MKGLTLSQASGEPLRQKCAPADGLRTGTTRQSTSEAALAIEVVTMEVARVAMKAGIDYCWS